MGRAGATGRTAKTTAARAGAATTKRTGTASTKRASAAKTEAAKAAAVKARSTQTASRSAEAKATAAKTTAARAAAAKAAAAKAEEAKAEEKAQGAAEEAAKVAAIKAATPTTSAKTARKTTGRPAAKARKPATPPAPGESEASGETETSGAAASTAKRPTKAAATKSEPVTTADAKTPAAKTKAASSRSKAVSSSRTKTTAPKTKTTAPKTRATAPKAGTTAPKETAATKRPLVRAENVTDVAEVNAPVVQEDGRADAVPAPAAIAEGTAASVDESTAAPVDEGAAISVEEKAVAAETAEASHTPAAEEPEDPNVTDTPEAGAESEGPERDTAEVSADTVEPGSDRYALVIRGLVKTFGEHRAVDGVSLTVPAGSFYGIVGPNGAGKTTTLSIVAGLLSADEGAVHVCGVDQRKDPREVKRLMGVLPDRLRTFDRLTGRQLLHYYGLLRGLAADVVEKRTADLARAFDLTGALGRVVSDYSAGMTKKIMLAGAMIHSPRVLVLDEPFESVDPVSSGVILDILGAYVAHGGTVILSSHGMDLVEKVCSRIAIIVGGEVLAEGTVDEVRAGQTLEQRFVKLSGGAGEVEGLEWLHAFSD